LDLWARRLVVFFSILIFIISPVSLAEAAKDTKAGKDKSGGSHGEGGGSGGPGKGSAGDGGAHGKAKGSDRGKGGGPVSADRHQKREHKKHLKGGHNKTRVNKSHDNLRNITLNISFTEVPPYTLKLQALEEVNSLEGWGEDNHRLRKTSQLINRSLTSSLWLDERHILSERVMKLEMQAAQHLRVLISTARRGLR